MKKIEKTLLVGFPKKLQSDLVWQGKDLAKDFDWDYHLSKADLAEINNAIQQFKGRQI